MYVNTYVLEKLVDVWLAERRADAARLGEIERAGALAAPETRETKSTKAPRCGMRWLSLQLGR